MAMNEKVNFKMANRIANRLPNITYKEPLFWIRFGKLLSIKTTTKNNNDDDDSIELNFEYSNSKIMYYSANVEVFLKAKLKAEALIGEDVDLFCYDEGEYKSIYKLWFDIRKTNNELHKIDKVRKEWTSHGKLASVLVSENFIEIKCEYHYREYFVKTEIEDFSLMIKKVKLLIGKEVEIFKYERNLSTDQFDYFFCFDIKEYDKTKQTKKIDDDGFFRDMDIPYEGLTDDEQDGW